MLNHVMAVVDSAKFGEYVLAQAEAIARPSGAKITLLRVLDPSADRSRSGIVDPLDWHIRKMEVEAQLNEMIERVDGDQRPAVTPAVLEGADADQISQYAEANGVDLIVLTKQTENVSELVHEVMKRTTTPVVILPVNRRAAAQGAPEDAYRKILLPLDGSQRAEIALSIASAFAQSDETEFVLAHVVRKPEIPRNAPPNTEESQLAERIVELNRADAERYLDGFAARLPGKAKIELLVSDNIAATLHQLADQENVDLVILSAHGYTGEPRWPYGSVTSNLIAYSNKPVLVVQDLPVVTTPSYGAVPTVRLYRRAG